MMPVTAGPNSVHDLISAARRYFTKTGRRVTFEYALIDGVNDSPETARQLGGLLRGSGSHVNLIPVNPTTGGFGRPSRNRVMEFERIPVSYTHLRAHETPEHLVCRLLLEKKKHKTQTANSIQRHYT